MKLKFLAKVVLFINLTSFLLVLFSAPNPAGFLRLAQEDLRKHLSASTDSESSKEYLRLQINRIGRALSGYEFQITLYLGVTLTSIILIAIILFLNRSRTVRDQFVERKNNNLP